MRTPHLLLAFATVLAPLATPALAAPRPAADVARDAARKPAAMMAFAQVKPGETVIELIPGGGYFTRVLSDAVGPTGHVISVIPAASAQRNPKEVAAMQALAQEPGRGNVTVVVEPLGHLAAPGSADLVWTSQNYHDLHNPALPADTIAKVNRAAFEALKPGGLYVIEDHAAAPGSGVRDVATLHRIDPAVVRREVEAAGFRFDGESKALANPADDHTRKVFDPSIRGHTDQFVFRFKKPA